MPYIERIHNRFFELFHTYIDLHSKTLAVRFDLRYPYDYTDIPNNRHISTCMDILTKHYRMLNMHPCYFWVREESIMSPHPHYHCMLLLDGQKTMHFHHVFDNALVAWSKAIGDLAVGCLDKCLPRHHYQVLPVHLRYNGNLLRRDRPRTHYEQCKEVIIRQLNYLCKQQSKSAEYRGQRNFGCTQLSTLLGDNKDDYRPILDKSIIDHVHQ